MRKKILLIVAFMAFLLPQMLCGEDYAYTAYDFDMTVREDNTYRITETVDVEFENLNLHGLLYKIPLDTSNYIKATVGEVGVEEHQFETYSEGNNFFIKIGDKNKTVNEKERYIISYTYNIGDDGIKKYDQVYHNLISTGGDYKIENITFNIKMPKEFDVKLINFTSGEKGSKDNTKVKYEIHDDFSITGTLAWLNPKQGLTMKIKLQEGYFDQVVSRKADFADILLKYSIIAFPLILIIGFIIWWRYGKSDLVVPVVEFYPPEDATPADVGYIIDGEVDSEDITSLLIYWADKGYMTIVENETKGLLKKKSFTFNKIKDLPNSAHNYEKKMFDAIFTYGNGSSVTTEDLEEKFYTEIKALNVMITNTWHDEIFETSTIDAERMLIIFSILPIFLVLMAAVIRMAVGNLTGVAVIFTTIFILAAAVVAALSVHLFSKAILNYGNMGLASRVILILMSPIVPIIVFLVCNSVYVGGVALIAIAMSLIFNFLSCFAKKRSKKGLEYQGRLLGFKQFLLTAEKDKINMLSKENPQYFYNILPYALVLHVTDKWAKNFNNITIAPPDWYDNDSTSDNSSFQVTTFSGNLVSGMAAISNSMSSSPGSDSADSDGGSSGGGSGGSSSSGW